MNSSLDISKIVASISFIIGTLLLVLFLFFKQEESLIMLGFYYVIGAFIINTFVLLSLLTRLILNSENRIELLKAIGIILINIPIAIGYFFIVINTL